MPDLDREVLLEVRNLRKVFPVRGSIWGGRSAETVAVDGVSLRIGVGETLGLVGESGCGKTTTGRCILRLIEPTSGSVSLAGEDLLAMRGAQLRRFRRNVQIIFQDPYGSLNPRMTVGDAIAEALEVHAIGTRRDRPDRVVVLLERVGLEADHVRRYPHEFSGGQRQRIGIARALAPRPRLVVADEPVSALDVSVQAQVLNLLQELQLEFGVSYLFIAHDLAVVQHLSHRIAVMAAGRVVEEGRTEEVISRPQSAAAQALLASVPRVGR
jgi:peptide/nickel transport system ATP-binding protein